MIDKLKNNRLVLVSAALYFLVAFAVIPNGTFPHAFDKNAFPEFIALIIVASSYGAFILLNRARFVFTGKAMLALWLLIASVTVSTLLSADPISSLTGDSGRYAGVVSLLCLLVVAIYHGQFTEVQIRKLIAGYLVAAFAMEFVGFGEHVHWWAFPTAGGVAGTLGNMDFFSAYVGTAIPLFIYFVCTSQLRGRIIAGLGTAASFYALVLATRREAWVDVALVAILLIAYQFRRFLPIRSFNLNAKTTLFTLFFIIWIEGIFLMPFLGKSVPLLGNDPQVQIRGQFWTAGISEFLHSPIFGFGPDQYGNYYERFRTLESAKQFPFILSNDAHAATVQTLATLGIVGSAFFVLLLALFIRSLLILIARKPEHKTLYAFLGLYALVFLTNSAVSPITFPNKFIFWGIAGFVVGSAYRQRVREREVEARRNSMAIRTFVAISAVLSIFVGANVAIGETRMNIATEKLVKNHADPVKLQPSAFIPCAMASDSFMNGATLRGGEAQFQMALTLVREHPRCATPRIVLAKLYYVRHNLQAMGQQIVALEGIVPDRNEFLQTALGYAQAVHDSVLTQQIVVQLEKTGVLSFTKAPAKKAAQATSSTATSASK